MNILASTIARIEEEFALNFSERGELGASVSIWMGTSEICCLHGGFRERTKTVPWDSDTLVPVWSATKGPASICVLLALHSRGMSPETRVGEIWPELAMGLMKDLPVGDLLAHRGGLCTLDSPAKAEDYPAVIRALEAQSPAWTPGQSHGYHPRTFGYLADELVRRLADQPLGVYWRNRVADALALDFWIGLPLEEDHRVAEMVPPPQGHTDPDSEAFYHALSSPKSLTQRSFRSPLGLEGVRDINRLETRRLSLPAQGGIGSARALAQFYAVLANGGEWCGYQLVPGVVCEWAEQTRSSGPDQVLLNPTAFSAGFMKDPQQTNALERRHRFGPSLRAFGHPGAGGSHAFADPAGRIAFAYVMNRMERSVFPTRKALSLVRRLYQA